MIPLPQLAAPIGRAQELNDLVDVFSTVRTTRHGQTVFLLGAEGMHRKATARKFLQEIGKESNVVTASVQFHDPEKHPNADWEKLVSEDARWKNQYKQFAPLVQEFFPKAIQIAGLPWLALAAQLVAKSKTLLEAIKMPRSFVLQDDPLVLKEFMRHVSEHYHVAIVLEDLTYAESPWIDILRRLLDEINRDLPLLFIATVDAAVPLEKIPKEHLLESQRLVKQAMAERVAQTDFFAPLTLDHIHHLFPLRLDAALAHRLLHWTDGIPELMRVLWNEWARKESIEYSPTGILQARAGATEWVWGPAKDMTEQQVEQLLDEESPFDPNLVFSILQFGALEGSPFTAEAVAEACQGDTDEFIDFFDDYLVESEENPGGILNEAGWATILIGEGEKELALYAFRFPFHEHVFTKYPSDAQTRGNAFALAQALEKTYYPQTYLHARKLARLWTLAGNEGKARAYQQMLAISDNIEILRWHVSILERYAQDKFDLYRLFSAQIKLGKELFNRVHYLEIVELFKGAVTTAERLDNVQDQAEAHYYLGWAWSEGGEYAKARQALETSRKLALQVHARDILAATLHQLGIIESAQGNYPAARKSYEESLALKRALDDKRGIATTLHALGNIEFVQGNYPAAHALYEESLALGRALDDKLGIATTLHALGNIEYQQDNYPAARKSYEESLALERALDDKRGIATTLHALGNIESDQGNYPAARKLYEESLALERALDNKRGIARTLHALGNIESDQGNYPAARKSYEESLALKRELGAKGGIARTLHQLGNIEFDQGNYPAARALYEESLALERALDDKGGIAHTLYMLGHVEEKEGNRFRAIKLMKSSVAIFQQLGSPEMENVAKYLARLLGQE